MIGSKVELYQYAFCPEKHKLQYVEKAAVPPTREMVLRVDENLKKNVYKPRDLILEQKYIGRERMGMCSRCEYKGVCWDDSDN